MRRGLILLLALGACGRGSRAEPEITARPDPGRPTVDPGSTAERRPTVPTPPAAADTLDPLAPEATAAVDRQHEAYNRHDVEAFLATYADSVLVHTLGDTLVLKGKPQLRESTEAWFARAPQARTEVIERMVLGPFVIDHQRVSGGPEGAAAVEAIGIYEVREGLIRQVWSIPPPPTPR
jgi:hypothetical protein